MYKGIKSFPLLEVDKIVLLFFQKPSADWDKIQKKMIIFSTLLSNK